MNVQQNSPFAYHVIYVMAERWLRPNYNNGMGFHSKSCFIVIVVGEQHSFLCEFCIAVANSKCVCLRNARIFVALQNNGGEKHTQTRMRAIQGYHIYYVDGIFCKLNIAIFQHVVNVVTRTRQLALLSFRNYYQPALGARIYKLLRSVGNWDCCIVKCI